jgi:hypothetical protein
MVNYPYYERCCGCDESLPHHGTEESKEVKTIGVELPLSSVNYVEVYCHNGCKEKASKRLTDLLKNETHHLNFIE